VVRIKPDLGLSLITFSLWDREATIRVAFLLESHYRG